MSAAKDLINKKWIDWIASLLISIIVLLTSFGSNFFGSLASREYVDKENQKQNESVEKDIEAMRREQELSNKSIFMILQRIDKRTERLEDRLNKNFDK